MLRAISLILYMLVCTTHVAAQPTASAIVEAFFAFKGIPNKREIYTDEMLRFVNERTMGQYLEAGATKEYRLLFSSDSIARYAIAVKSGGRTQDWYAFLTKSDGTWRLQAVRTLTQTGLIVAVAEGLRAKPNRTAKENWELRHADLTLSSDTNLKEFLKTTLPAFEALAVAVRNEPAVAANTAAKKLFLSSAHVSPAGYVKLTIGGILDNTVGYIYAPDVTTLPTVTPSDFIYLERFLDHWYIFKTT